MGIIPRAKKLFICLDFDGTLAPFRRAPGDARLSEQKREILRKLAVRRDYRVAVVSGRGLKDIEDKISVPAVMYAADHGFFIKSGGKVFQPFSSPAVRGVMKDFHKEAGMAVGGVRGIVLENKGITLSVHYRCVPKNQVPGVKALISGLGATPGFKDKLDIRGGKMCLEIRPRVPWDKGSAVTWLMLRAMKEDAAPFLPVYIGDDATDEDAFKVLRNVGITIRVGNDRLSRAEYYVKNTSEVFEFLKVISRGGR